LVMEGRLDEAVAHAARVAERNQDSALELGTPVIGSGRALEYLGRLDEWERAFGAPASGALSLAWMGRHAESRELLRPEVERIQRRGGTEFLTYYGLGQLFETAVVAEDVESAQ